MKVDLFNSNASYVKRLSFAAIILILFGTSSTGVFGQNSIGSEFQVNTYTFSDQINPSVALAPGGNFVCVWNSRFQDGDGYGVYARIYDQNGDTLGSEFRVNANPTSWQFGSDIAIAPDGSFVITWDGELVEANDDDVYYRRFDSIGNPLTGDVVVNTHVSDDQRTSEIAMDSMGNFVIVWQSLNQDGDGAGIFGQRFDANGNKVGPEFQVNTYTTNWQYAASVDMAPDGRFVVAWTSINQDGDWQGNFAQRFDANGNKVGSEFQVNSTTIYGQRVPNVAMKDDGSFLISWESEWQDGSSIGVYAKMYDSNGDTTSGEFRVNSTTFSEQSVASADTDSEGNFIITWQSFAQDGDGFSIIARTYLPGGDTLGPEFIVNSTSTNAQQDPAITLNDNGDFIILWESYLQDGDENGIYGQRFHIDFPNGSNCGSPDPLMLTGNVTMDTTYSTAQYIESSQIVLSGVTVSYEAAQTIDLLPGFEIQAGAEISMEVVDCSGN